MGLIAPCRCSLSRFSYALVLSCRAGHLFQCAGWKTAKLFPPDIQATCCFSCCCSFPHWAMQWFRPAGRVPFGSRPKRNQKGLPPTSGPACGGVPSLHHRSRGTTGCGPPTKGHPWPIVALATSMSLNPFHGDSTRPPEGGLGVVCEIRASRAKAKTRPPQA